MRYRADTLGLIELRGSVGDLTVDQRVEHYCALESLGIPPVDGDTRLSTLDVRYEVHAQRVARIRRRLVFVFDVEEHGIVILAYMGRPVNRDRAVTEACKALGLVNPIREDAPNEN